MAGEALRLVEDVDLFTTGRVEHPDCFVVWAGGDDVTIRWKLGAADPVGVAGEWRQESETEILQWFSIIDSSRGKTCSLFETTMKVTALT